MLRYRKGKGAAIRIAHESDLAAFEQPWRDLERRSAPHTMAQTYNFAAAAVQEALAANRQVFLLVAHDDRLTGILGLVLYRGFHRTLMPFSCGSHEEYAGPLIEAGREEATAMLLLQVARSIAADRIALVNLVAGGVTDQAARASGLRQYVYTDHAAYISSRRYKSWSEAEPTMSRADRRSLRKTERRLREAHPGVEYFCGWCETIEDSNRALDFLMKTKREWLARTGNRSKWLNKPDVPAFFQRLIRKTDLKRFPLISELRVGDRTIAASACLHNEAKIDYLISAVDPAYLKYSSTKLLIRFASEYALDHGRDFDFCATIQNYKREWPVDIKELRSLTLYVNAFGHCPTPAEIGVGARKALGPYKRRLLGAVRSKTYAVGSQRKQTPTQTQW